MIKTAFSIVANYLFGIARKRLERVWDSHCMQLICSFIDLGADWWQNNLYTVMRKFIFQGV